MHCFSQAISSVTLAVIRVISQILSGEVIETLLIPGDNRVEVARVGVVSPLVGTVELLGGNAAVLQVLAVPAHLEAPGLGPSCLPTETAGEADDVVVSGQAGETGKMDSQVISDLSDSHLLFLPRLRQTKLLTISPVGHLLHNLIIKTFQFPVENSLKGPGLVSALVHDAPKADFLKVVRSVPLGQIVAASLGVSVQRETSLAVVVDREGGAVGAFG